MESKLNVPLDRQPESYVNSPAIPIIRSLLSNLLPPKFANPRDIVLTEFPKCELDEVEPALTVDLKKMDKGSSEVKMKMSWC